jgi:surface protein
MSTDINLNKILSVPGSTSIRYVVPTYNKKLFISVWETQTNGEFIMLPYDGGGTYNGTIDWGDGSTDINDGSVIGHTYLSKGVYTITINGIVIGWNFSNLGGSPYIISVVQWGPLQLGSDLGFYFQNCPNLDLSTVSDKLNLAGITNMVGMFEDCSSITIINNINLWITSAITTMNGMFYNCSSFNQTLIFDTSLVNDMSLMFYNCTIFDKPLLFNTLSVNLMNDMFYGATAFDQDIGFWDVTFLGQANGFMGTKTPATFSTTNLDAIYNGWSATAAQTGVFIDFNGAKYSPASIAGRSVLTVTKLWNISDGGL